MSLKMLNFALVNQGIPEKLTLFRHDNPLVRARSAFSPHFTSREHNYLCIKKIPPPPRLGFVLFVPLSGAEGMCFAA